VWASNSSKNKHDSLLGVAAIDIAGLIAPNMLPKCCLPELCMPVRILAMWYFFE
jgi:hypothetical protein